MYEYGEGVSEDKVEAVKWYRLGAEQGDTNGQAYLGKMVNISEEGQDVTGLVDSVEKNGCLNGKLQGLKTKKM